MEFTEAKPHISESKINLEKEEELNQKTLKLNLANNINLNNDDDYLGFNSKYQTSNFNYLEKRTDSLEKKSTTNSSSENFSNENNNNENKFFSNFFPSFNNNYNRKMSSPIFLYYEGFDKYKSKKNPSLKDYYIKSNNFIEKDIYYNQFNSYENDFEFKNRTFSFDYKNLKDEKRKYDYIKSKNFNNENYKIKEEKKPISKFDILCVNKQKNYEKSKNIILYNFYFSK